MNVGTLHTCKMPYSPEQWAALCERAKKTQEGTAHVLAETYKTYQNAKKNCDEMEHLTSTHPEIQVKIEELRTRCKAVLQEAEQNLQSSLQNMERATEMVQETEQFAMVVSENYKN